MSYCGGITTSQLDSMSAAYCMGREIDEYIKWKTRKILFKSLQLP